VLMVLYLQVPRRRLRLAAGWFCVAGFIVAASVFDLHSPSDPRFRFGFLAHMYLFMAGIVLADFAYGRDMSAQRRSGFYDAGLACGLGVLVCVGLYLTRVNAMPGGGWPEIFADLAMLVAITAIYFGAMRGRIGGKLFSTPWMTLIGTMCYSIYLVHVVVIEALAHVLWHIRLTEPAEIWGLYIVVLGPVSLCVSGLFYIAIERPFMTPSAHLPGASFFRHRSKTFLRRCRALWQHRVS